MAHVATITIDHTKVPGDLTDYVGLIVPDGSAGYSALYALCLEGGGDIRLFKSDDTTELAREIVSFSVSAETGEIHYKYSGTLSSSVDTDIHVYADGSSSDYAVGATYGRNNVWVDYLFVAHDGGGTDSTGNVTPTANGGVIAGGVTGQIGVATDFDGSNDNFDLGDLDSSSLTVSAWANVDTKQNQYIASKYTGASATRSWILRYDGSNWEFDVIQSSGAFSVAEWPDSSPVGDYRYIVGVYDNSGNDGFLYVDGVERATSSPDSLNQTNTTVKVGSHGAGGSEWDGEIDEVRIKETPDSANWITTEYNNQNSPTTFYSVAAVAGSSAAQAARRGVIMMM